MLTKLNWRGRIILGGDFNEEWGNAWISIPALLFGLEYVEPCLEGTRWESERVIDYFMVSEGMEVASTTHCAKISDHKIVILEADLHLERQRQQKFFSFHNFKRPDWIPSDEWDQCIQESVLNGIREGWEAVCFAINHSPKWVLPRKEVPQLAGGGTCPRDRCYLKSACWGDLSQEHSLSQINTQQLDQQMVDYGWELCSRKILWVFQHACFRALLRIPAGYEDFDETRRVELLYNGNHWRGTNQLLDILPPRHPRPWKVAVNKLRRRLGRVNELAIRAGKGKMDEQFLILHWKLFGKRASCAEIESERVKLEKQIGVMEAAQKAYHLRQWRLGLNDPKAKGAWLNPKKAKRNVGLVHEDQVTRSKRELVVGMRDAWLRLMKKVAWTEEERAVAVEELSNFYAMHLGTYEHNIGRPDAKALAAALMAVSGCPGLDGWSAEEASMIGKNLFLRSWELAGITPSSLQDVSLLFIPKAGKKFDNGYGPSSHFRPLSIYSVIWRAWSGSWIGLKGFQTFIQARIPAELSASHKGGIGSETLAALLAHQLEALGYGCTLDYSSCFDTVDLKVLFDSLRINLPIGLQRWCRLLLTQWMVSNKWFGANGYTFEEPYIGEIGIPQGDGASPIILAFMIWPGFQQVQERLSGLGGSFYQGVYMDDRTVIADRPDIIEQAIVEWADFSRRMHLVENPDEAQKVSVGLHIEGYGDCMEVLGAIVGKGSLNGTLNNKQKERIDKAVWLIKRIGILPEARWKRLEDIYICLCSWSL